MNIFAPQGGGLWRRASSGRVVYPNAGQQQRFALVGMATSGLVALLAVCLRAAPVFTLSILGIIAIVLLYILTEHWKTHDAVEFQNRFWSLVAFVFAWVCFFIRDSPLRFSERNSHFAWFGVFIFSYAAHNYDRHLRRLVLSKVPRLPRVASADIDQELKTAARYKIAELKKYTTVIDNPYVSSTFQNVVNIFKVLHAEQNIITIFEEASKVSSILSTPPPYSQVSTSTSHKYAHHSPSLSLSLSLSLCRTSSTTFYPLLSLASSSTR
jgi:hypothetical protein